MDWKSIPVSDEFYNADYDSEANHYETPKCSNGCGGAVEIDGHVCQTCYDEE